MWTRMLLALFILSLSTSLCLAASKDNGKGKSKDKSPSAKNHDDDDKIVDDRNNQPLPERIGIVDWNFNRSAGEVSGIVTLVNNDKKPIYWVRARIMLFGKDGSIVEKTSILLMQKELKPSARASKRFSIKTEAQFESLCFTVHYGLTEDGTDNDTREDRAKKATTTTKKIAYTIAAEINDEGSDPYQEEIFNSATLATPTRNKPEATAAAKLMEVKPGTVLASFPSDEANTNSITLPKVDILEGAEKKKDVRITILNNQGAVLAGKFKLTLTIFNRENKVTGLVTYTNDKTLARGTTTIEVNGINMDSSGEFDHYEYKYDFAK